jgi:hypothetical protein
MNANNTYKKHARQSTHSATAVLKCVHSVLPNDSHILDLPVFGSLNDSLFWPVDELGQLATGEGISSTEALLHSQCTTV